jgi:Mg-chelatase subunit ChlD
MQHVRFLFGGLAIALFGTALSAQSQPPAVSASVFAPPSVQCSAQVNSSLTLTGFNNETPGTADIVVVMDESGSIAAAEWAQIDGFFDALVDSLDLAGSNNRVALVKYSSTAQLVVPFTQNATTLKSVPRTFPGGSTATHSAIQLARTYMSANVRPTANRFIIVITDGVCTCTLTDLNTQARQAELAGSTVIAVGVAGANVTELDLIATDIPGVDTSLFVTNFDELNTLIDGLIEAIVTPAATNVSVVVNATPRFPVTGATATAGTVNITGVDQITWTLPSLGAGSQTLSITQQHDGTGHGTQQVFSATYTDAEAHAVTIDPATTVVNGCNVAPVANAGPDQTVALQGATAPVTLDGSGSTDDGLLQPLEYHWAGSLVTATGVSPTVALPLGTHSIALTVWDGEFVDIDSVTIRVVDTTAPEIGSVTPSTGTLWPPNHRMVPVTFTVNASDNSGVPPVCTVTGVASSESANGKGDGNTTGDAVITGPLSVDLRSERAGGGNGRTYTVTVSCTDASGNTTTGTATVVAPHSQGKK